MKLAKYYGCPGSPAGASPSTTPTMFRCSTLVVGAVCGGPFVQHPLGPADSLLVLFGTYRGVPDLLAEGCVSFAAGATMVHP